MGNIIKKQEMVANDLTAAFATHPGAILKDEIEYRGISQCQLAKEMGMAYSALNEILNEKRPLTEKTAMLFEAALGVNAEPLLRLQMKYTKGCFFYGAAVQNKKYCICTVKRRRASSVSLFGIGVSFSVGMEFLTIN